LKRSLDYFTVWCVSFGVHICMPVGLPFFIVYVLKKYWLMCAICYYNLLTLTLPAARNACRKTTFFSKNHFDPFPAAYEAENSFIRKKTDDSVRKYIILGGLPHKILRRLRLKIAKIQKMHKIWAKKHHFQIRQNTTSKS